MKLTAEDTELHRGQAVNEITGQIGSTKSVFLCDLCS